MDKAIKDINSQVRTCNTEIKVAKENIEHKQEELEKTAWVEDAEKLARKLESFHSKMKKEMEDYNNLHDKINHIMEISDVLETQYYGIDGALKALEALNKEKRSIDDEKHTVEQIEDLISAMTDVDLELNATTDIDEALNALESLDLERQKIEKIKKEYKEIDYILCMLEKNKTESAEADIELINAQQEYGKIREEEECPTCGRTGV
jgi:DNA repair exonuclease SbcCD ATPase subunit